MISLASAVSLNGITEISSPTNTSHDSSVQINFNLTNTGTLGDLNWSYSNFTSSQTGLIITFDKSAIAASTTENFVATINFDDYQTGTITGNIGVANDGSGVDESLAFSIVILSSKQISVSTSTIAQGSNSTTITIKNEGNAVLNNINLTATGDFNVNFSSDLIVSLNAGDSTSITVTSTSDLNDLLGISSPKVTITANASDGTTSTGTVSATATFCEDALNNGNLEITIEDIKVKRGFGDDNDYWYPFDVIEAEINIENDGNWDIEDVELSWELYTTAGKKITDDTENDFNLDENDDKTLTITFTLDEDIDDLEGEDLILYVKASGKIDDKDSTYDNEETCDSASEEVNLITNDNFVIIDDIEINGMKLEDLELIDVIACGTELQIVADIWNIGDDDQEDVIVLIKNNELGISKKVTIGDIDKFEYEKLETTFTIPENAEAKEYTFDFMIYDEDNDLFETDEDDKAIFKVRVNVDGNCKAKESAKITAALISEAQAGEILTVKTTITNTESKTVTYIINVKDYEEWATLEDIEKSITLVAGESRDIELTFNVKKGVSGDKIFNLETISDSEIITTQPVSISIAPQKSLLGISLPENNIYLWGIGALNVLLILSIIVVAIRLSKE